MQLSEVSITDAEADALLAEPLDPRFNTPESLARVRALFDAKLAEAQPAAPPAAPEETR